MPIGGVAALQDAVCPNMVGVDIGCGMTAVRTGLKEITVQEITEIIGLIRQTVPVGFAHHSERQDEFFMPPDFLLINGGICRKEYDAACYQIGTLGGGNHFIEIQRGSDGYIWFMIHSGSRNLGKKVADYYNQLAVDLNDKQDEPVPPSWELCYLPAHSAEGLQYFAEMMYCVNFARANRMLIASRVCATFLMVTGNPVTDEVIDVAHNYAVVEDHFGKAVYVHRKGATPAKKDEVGIIPGSQGTKSYIVKGLGNPESFASCSHGAGRKMSRSTLTE